MHHAAAWLTGGTSGPPFPLPHTGVIRSPSGSVQGRAGRHSNQRLPPRPSLPAQARLHSAPGGLLQCREASRACMHSRSRGLAADHRSGGSPGECHTSAGLDLDWGSCCSLSRRAGGTTAHTAATRGRRRWPPRLTAFSRSLCAGHWTIAPPWALTSSPQVRWSAVGHCCALLMPSRLSQLLACLPPSRWHSLRCASVR